MHKPDNSWFITEFSILENIHISKAVIHEFDTVLSVFGQCKAITYLFTYHNLSVKLQIGRVTYSLISSTFKKIHGFAKSCKVWDRSCRFVQCEVTARWLLALVSEGEAGMKAMERWEIVIPSAGKDSCRSAVIFI